MTVSTIPNEPPVVSDGECSPEAKSMCEKIKYFLSFSAVHLLLLVVVVSVGNKYCVWQFNQAGLFILLILALTWLAYVEGLHYAVVSCEKRDMSQCKDTFSRAFKTHQLVNTTQKVKKFLVGRQFFTIFVVFIISQITSFPNIPQDFATMPKLMVNVLVQTGLPGVALVLTYGQLISQLYVEQYTLSFFNLYGCNFVVNVCLGAEWLGICHFSHLLFHTMSRLFCGTYPYYSVLRYSHLCLVCCLGFGATAHHSCTPLLFQVSQHIHPSCSSPSFHQPAKATHTHTHTHGTRASQQHKQLF